MSNPPGIPLNKPTVQVSLGIDSTVPLNVASNVPISPNNEYQLSLYEIVGDELWPIGFEEFLYDVTQLAEVPYPPWILPPVPEELPPPFSPFGFESFGMGSFG